MPVKKTTKKTKRNYLTQEAMDYVVNNLCKGISIAQSCRLNPNLPDYDHIIRESNPSSKNTAFSEAVTDAYTAYYMVRMDEIDRLTTTDLTELYPDMIYIKDKVTKKYILDENGVELRHKDGWKMAEATRKARVQAIQFDLSRLAPTFSRRFDKTTKLEVTGGTTNVTTHEHIVQAINYSDTIDVTPTSRLIDTDKD